MAKSSPVPRLYQRGPWWYADLRKWGGERTVLRNPAARGWPEEGDRTQDAEVAMRWALRYVDRLREQGRKQQLGMPAPVREKRSLKALVDEYLDQRALVAAPNTYRGFVSALNHLSAALGERATADSLTRENLQRMFNEMVRRGYAPRSLAVYRTRIQQFVVALGLSREVAAVTIPEPPEEDVDPLTDAEVEAVRVAADALISEGGYPYARRAVELALATGMREGELFGSQWGDLQEVAIRVSRQVTRDGTLAAPKSRRARTTLILPSWWPHHQAGASGLILPGRDGKLMGRNASYLLGRDLLERAEVYYRGRGWHVFRHTYARLCLEEHEVTLEELQMFMGHRSVAVTQGSYGHYRPSHAVVRAGDRIYQSRGMRIVK